MTKPLKASPGSNQRWKREAIVIAQTLREMQGAARCSRAGHAMERARSRQARLHQFFECLATTDGIGYGVTEAFAFRADPAIRYARIQLRRVEAYARAADGGIGAAAQAQGEIDGVLDARQRI